jgi:histidine triad (HIT) family protein
MSDAECLFCRMANGEIPVEKLHDDDLIFAVSDIAPRAPVHLLIIPKEHIASAYQLSEGHDALLGRMFSVGRRLATENGLEEGGYRLALNIGKHGGQTIYHLHMHLLGGRQLGAEG